MVNSRSIEDAGTEANEGPKMEHVENCERHGFLLSLFTVVGRSRTGFVTCVFAIFSSVQSPIPSLSLLIFQYTPSFLVLDRVVFTMKPISRPHCPKWSMS